MLGLVGESGAGKSMVGRAIANLLPPGFTISAGACLFQGRDLVRMEPEARRALLGREIAFIPQSPQTALDPLQTIGAAVRRAPAARRRRHRPRARGRAVAMLAAAHLREPEQAARQLSASTLRRHVPARAHRHGIRRQSAPRHRRRGDDRARCHDPAAHPAADRRDAAAVPHRADLHHPQPAHRRPDLRRDRGHVRGRRGRGRARAGGAGEACAPLYAMPAARRSFGRRPGAVSPPGADARPARAGAHVRLRIRAALPEC